MESKKKQDPNDPTSDKISTGNEKDMKQAETGDDFYEQWKNPDQNNMGNDIESEINIANSGGEKEGGSDNRWHMKDNDERNDKDDEIGD